MEKWLTCFQAANVIRDTHLFVRYLRFVIPIHSMNAIVFQMSLERCSPSKCFPPFIRVLEVKFSRLSLIYLLQVWFDRAGEDDEFQTTCMSRAQAVIFMSQG
jgi:hypothetical protein